MVLSQVTSSVITPAMALLPSKMDSPAARVMLLAIGLQESGFTSVVQANGGPAHGYWQFEQGGGVKGVFNYVTVAPLAEKVCQARGVLWSIPAIWAALASDQVLACCLARLLLFTDAAPLPAVGDASSSWLYYERNWRPGRPRPNDWPGNHQQAYGAIVWGASNASE
jgi:hypothetical protein